MWGKWKVTMFPTQIFPGYKILTFLRSRELCQVQEKKAKHWCSAKGKIPYFETSAKEDFNVDNAFKCIAQNALKNEDSEDMYVFSHPLSHFLLNVRIGARTLTRSIAGACTCMIHRQVPWETASR